MSLSIFERSMLILIMLSTVIFFHTPALLGLTLTIYCIQMIAVTLGFHRYFSHKAFKTSRIFQFFLACIGCLALQNGPMWWASIHRKHHKFSDTEQDPHSPKQKGFWYAYVGWLFDKRNAKVDYSYLKDFEKYPEILWIDKHHYLPPFLLSVILLLLGWEYFYWGFLFPTFLSWQATYMITTLCHLVGYQSYETHDDSKNNLLVSFFTFGEGWHNNHHFFPSSAKHGFSFWEFDPNHYFIKLLEKMGLVWDVKKYPKNILDLKKQNTSLLPIPSNHQK